MPLELQELLIREVSTAEILVGVLGIISAGAFAALLASPLGEKVLPTPSESRVADFLPFRRLLADGATIECRDGTLCQVFRVAGADMATIKPAEREQLLHARIRWVHTLSDLEVEVRVFTIREKIPTNQEVTHENPLLARIATAWNGTLDKVFSNRHYVVLQVPPRRNAQRDLDQAAQAMRATLSEYGVTPLVEAPDRLPEDGPLAVFARLASPLSKPVPRAGSAEDGDLNDLLTADTIHFTGDEGIIRYANGEREKLCAVIGLRSCGDAADEQMVADLLTLDGELVVMHNFRPVSRPKAMALLMQQKRQARITSFSENVMDQYDAALQLIDQSDENFQTIAKYAFTVFMVADDKEGLAKLEIGVERVCRLYGATPVREGFAAQPSWFAQFPTYDKYPREYKFLSHAVACSAVLEQAPEGRSRSDWGEGPITLFKTGVGTAYKWQFHVSEEREAVAHAVIIGPTGQGKTTIMAFMAGMAMRHRNLRVYFFDRHRGVEIFTKAVDGTYVTFNGDQDSATMNPFQQEDDPDTRAFLRRWLRAITNCDDAVSEREIGRAVTTAYEYLPNEERNLSNLHKACFSPTGRMRRELYRWVNPQQYGGIFNAAKDTLDFSSRLVTFDFTEIFQDEVLAPAVISYIMHRIHAVTGKTGEPSLIMIDETAPMLKHPMFKDEFIKGLQEGRKKRQAYLCAFQQPNIVDRLGMGEVIRGQCQTMIFFRNPQGTPEDYANWDLTPKELSFINGKYLAEMKHAILVKRPIVHESVILDVGLGGLGPLLKLFASGRRNVLLAEELRKTHGSGYVEKYLEVA